jgi:hypothetical protein
MAKDLRVNEIDSNPALDDIFDVADGGEVLIYTLPRPAGPASAPAGATLLATLNLPNPAFLAADDGVKTANAIPGASAVGTGDAAWFRIRLPGGRGVVDGQETYGKGSVQNLYPLDRYALGQDPGYGQLTVTIGMYYRVTGDSTQNRGVQPDISLPSAINAEDVDVATQALITQGFRILTQGDISR